MKNLIKIFYIITLLQFKLKILKKKQHANIKKCGII